MRYQSDIRNKYCILFLIGFVVTITSCQTIVLPNTLAPAKTYGAGNGEIGIRTLFAVPVGADFKIGLTDQIQVSGVVYPAVDPIDQILGAGIYEAGIQVNAEPSEKDIYLHIFGIGGGTEVSKKIISNSNNQINYIYQGYYPGYTLNEHISASFPLRLYEFMGRYNCFSQDICPGRGAQPMERYQGAVFIPEMDWSFDWAHMGVRLGINVPIQVWESYNPMPVIMLPDVSSSLYGKW